VPDIGEAPDRSNTEIRPFRIEIPQAALDDLRDRLAGTRYYEDKHSGAWPQPSGVPTGVARFSEDISIRRYAEQSNNIVHSSEFDRGGHFAALEAPDLLIGDVREFFRSHR
jgi:pimeloyl-ACP methyl ester carboxylesterase